MQPYPLLRTKLYMPPIRAELVSRPRLIERLNAGLTTRGAFSRALTLVSAPAGFGKTTLVREWLAGYEQLEPKVRAAWLSLDEGDNDPARFLAYVIAALRTIEANIGKGVLSALQSPQPPPVESVLVSLINEIAALPDSIILVLDDHHTVESSAVDNALAFLLEHLPPQMHLVIASREDPHLPLARLRARGQLTELRAADLRFTTSEAAEFLNQAMGLDLSLEDIATLEERTEGWIAGLQLAALSMKGREDTASVIRSFTGSHRYVLDYLVEEVLEQQSESVQTFLLQTAVLNRLTGSLCDALTGQDNGQATLEVLDHANLFTVPLDDERRWYRYHHLFAELLQQRSRNNHPHLIDDLHSRAAAWYEANGDLPEAIHHALARDDTGTAARLIEKGAFEALEQSDLRFILEGVDRLPDDALEEHPWLFIYHTWALLVAGQVEVVRPRLENTEWLLESLGDDDEAKKREMLGYIAGLKAQLSLWQRDYPNMIVFASRARANLPRDNWLRGYCANMMGAALQMDGDLRAAKDAFSEAAAIGKASGMTGAAVSGSCNLAYSLELEGHLQQALRLFQDTFHLAEEDGRVSPVAGYVHNEITKVLYELNELDLASQHAAEGIKLCQSFANDRAVSFGHYLMAKVQTAKGDFNGAVNSIQKAEQAEPSPGTRFDMRGAEYPQIRLWLKQNRLKEIDAWLHESGVNVDNVSHFKLKLTYTMHARALITLGRARPGGTYVHDALSLLEELLEMAVDRGWGSKVIEILVLQALAFQEEGNTAQTITTLEQALSLAEPEGFVRTFVDEGSAMARLLYEAAARGIAPDYARRLLAAFPVAEPEPTGPSISQTQEPDLIEPLSEREIEVLQLMAEGLTNPEIASRLFVSLNTVKAHARNIYGKLGVHNRTQAVVRARAVRILPPT